MPNMGFYHSKRFRNGPSDIGVKQSTCTAAVYSELGRYLHVLYINRHVILVKYWFKLKNAKII